MGMVAPQQRIASAFFGVFGQLRRCQLLCLDLPGESAGNVDIRNSRIVAGRVGILSAAFLPW